MTLSNESFDNLLRFYSRLHRNAQIKSICFTVYLLFNSKYQISYRCFISWRVLFKTLHSSNIRLITRSHVLQIDLTSYLKSTDLSNLDSFVSALFATMYDLALQNLRHRESLHESFRIRIVEEASELIVLKKFARKLQNLHRWESSRTRRWKSLHESSKSDSLKYWAEDINECCEKVLKSTIFADVAIKKSLDRNWRKKN